MGSVARASLLFALIVVSSSARAVAQDGSEADTEAREHFAAGSRYFDAGDYRAAAVEFEASYRLSGRPALLYNLYLAQERVGNTAAAVSYLERYLSDGEPGDRRAALEVRLENLRARLHEERLEAAQRADRERELREASDPGLVPWGVAAAGGVVAATGVVLLLVALSDVATVESPEGDMPRWEDSADAYGRAPVLSTVGGIALGVGAAAAITGVVWGLTASGPEGDDVATIAIGPGQIALRGTFR